MSANCYMDETLVKDEFQRIEDGIPRKDDVLRNLDQLERIVNGFARREQEITSHDQVNWSLGPITKNEYEQIVSQLNYTEDQKSLGSFELMKVLESMIESFLQILVIFVMFHQLPQEGMLNKSIFAFSTGNSEELVANISERDIFILTSFVSYFFLATGCGGGCFGC